MTATGLVVDTFRLLKQNFFLFFTLALAGQVIVTLLTVIIAGPLAIGVVDGDQAGVLADAAAGMAFAGFVSAFAGQVVSAVLHLAAWAVMHRDPIQPGAYVKKAVAVVLILVLLSLVVSIAVVLGIVLLIIPGIYIGAGLSVVIPAVVIGNAGWGAIGESWDLTREHRWTIAGGFILSILSILVISIVFGIIGSVTGLTVITDLLSGAIGLAVIAIFATLVYSHLTEAKGINPTALSPED
jgi:asparagine N-glycosylation enzyme membrane subunit Stt3